MVLDLHRLQLYKRFPYTGSEKKKFVIIIIIVTRKPSNLNWLDNLMKANWVTGAWQHKRDESEGSDEPVHVRKSIFYIFRTTTTTTTTISVLDQIL